MARPSSPHRANLRFPAPYSHVWVWATTAAVACAVTGVALGLWGYRHAVACSENQAAPTTGVLDVIWKSLALLVMQATPDSCDSWHLRLARLLAAIAALGALLLIAITHLHSLYKLQRLRRLEGHTVVITLGERGRSFLSSLTDRTIVTLDLDPTEWSVAATSGAGELHEAVGDASNWANLRAVNAPAARRILILGDNDTTNLQILQGVLSQARPSRTPQDIIMRIGNETLARGLNAQDSFVAPRTGIRVLAFNEDRVAALRFNDVHPLAELADRRARGRVQHVIVGQTAFALAALEQFVRLAPFKNFTSPRVDFFSDDPLALERLLAATRPAFLEHAFRHDDDLAAAPHAIAAPLPPGAGTPLLELHLWPTEPGSGMPHPRALEAVEPGPAPSVTSILVSAGEDGDAVALAMRLRELTRMSGRWTAPIFVRSLSDAAVAELHADAGTAGHDPEHSIIPVGLRSDTCSAEACFGMREALAQRFHEAYLASLHDAPPVAEQKPADRPWETLSPRYKARNRRAVDHLMPKLLSAGCVVLQRPPATTGPLFTASAALLEQMAALEHQSWECDMRTDGWRAGAVRDDARRVHDCIDIAYGQLAPHIRTFDVDQVRHADRVLTAPAGGTAPTVRREVVLGLFGHNRVSHEESATLQREVQKRMDAVFPEAGRPEFVSLLTPLAPGGDTLLAELTLAWLRETKVPHRLVIVRAIPRSVVIRLAHSSGVGARAWSVAQQPETATPDDIAARLALLEQPDPMLLGKSPHKHPTVLADIQAPGRSAADWQHDAALRTAAFQSANACIAQRADVVLAFVDPRRTTVHQGGAAEALQWCRDPGLIPPHLRHHARWPASAAPPVHVITGQET